MPSLVELPNDPYRLARHRMVEQQIRRRGIHDPAVVSAMSSVPRELFVGIQTRDAAYDDCALPIAGGQTISQPYTVAFMAERLGLKGNERVLEIGTGSGYGAAVLSLLAAEVHTIERLEELAEAARGRLECIGCRNVTVHVGDGSRGLPEHAPFDAIVATAAAERLPPAYFDQLVDGGRIVAPIGAGSRGQTMYRYVRRGDRLDAESLGAFAFVPLVEASE
ncbi:MAG: protein-L-isoaspartate(D-aspartate) O-methyltransferase [Pirellulales bacterium]